MKPLTVLTVASEVFPLIKTGGLADVIGALPAALAKEGIAVTTMVPGYPAVITALSKPTTVHTYDELLGGPARILKGKAAGLELLVLDAPHLFDRPGNPYSGPNGKDWPDNPIRFAALSAAAADVGRGVIKNFRPDVVHAHDWQAGLVPAYLHYGGGARPKTIMTVHNLAFQGQYAPELLSQIGLPPSAFSVDGVEYYGSIGYLKAGLQLCDHITTVSPTYASEIRSVEHGMGLHGLLRSRADVLSGILNGIDTTVWDPSEDELIAKTFDSRRLIARGANKAALQEKFGLAVDPDALLVGIVSRLTWQKGMDLLLEAMPYFEQYKVQLVILGAGDKTLEGGITAAAKARPQMIAAEIGYDEAMAHLIQAGADALLVPSRFEPCGLTQLCALRYGAVPIVSRVGGLADTVVDANEMALSAKAGTGIVFSPVSRDALGIAVERAARLWADRPLWREVQKRGLKSDVSWGRAAAQYAALYRGLVPAPEPTPTAA
jgi:starch synthase